jgi:hypothetical protein
MKMIKYFFLLSMISCAMLVDQIEKPIIDRESYSKNLPKIPTYCSGNSPTNLQLINSNENAQKIFADFLTNNRQLNFMDQTILWSLLQMSIRPDQSSPSARIQLMLKLQGQTYYMDFFSDQEKSQYPYLVALDTLVKKFSPDKSLEYYAALIDKVFFKLKLDKTFEQFLKLNTAKIKDDSILGPYFIRGTEVLKENETVPYLKFSDVIKLYRQQQKMQKVVFLSDLTAFKFEGREGRCNYDFNLYINSIFLIDKGIPDSNLFGIANGSNAFMAASSQKIENIAPIEGFPLFAGRSQVRSSAICQINSPENELWMFSNNSRDPGQHLFHLVRYGLSQIKSPDDADRLIRYSRHLFLSDPIRLVIESHRSRDEQVDNLLKLNLPIYNADKLGNIWAYTFFPSGGRFIIDDRNPGHFSCR